MADLQTDVRYIKGVGETRAAALARLGIHTLRDLITFFPRGYEDRTLMRPIRELVPGENACVRAMLAADPTGHPHLRRAHHRQGAPSTTAARSS